MMRIILTFGLAFILIMVSCNGRQSDKSKASDQVPAISSQGNENNIVYDSVTNGEGKTLYMTFNKTHGTATFVFEGDTITLQQDTMGSGIKYSNDLYQFTEWHGNGELKKDTATVFRYMK